MTAPPPPIRAALIGCGNSGRHYHLPLLLADPRIDLRAVAASRVESVAGLDLPGHVARVAGWESAVDRDDVDLVVIALPHHLHHPVAAAALDAGRHVLVEKPMTVRTAEADDLLARAGSQVLAVHHQRRWEADVQQLLEVIGSGDIGEPWRIAVWRGHQGHYATSTPAAPHTGADVVGWTRARASGGGVARLIGPHPIDHAIALAGAPVVDVAARAHRAAGEDVEDWIAVDLTFAGGLTAHVEVFRHTGVVPVRAAVWGSAGMAAATDGTRVEIHPHGGPARVVDGLQPPGRLGGEVYDDVVGAITEGRELRVPARHAREVVAVIERAERSAGLLR